jgi:hypothetical protein
VRVARIRLLGGLLGLALGFGSAAGAAVAGDVRGTVWSPSCGIEPGVCLWVRTAGATVYGCRVGAAGCAQARSRSDGSYRLRLPGPGRYRLVAVVRGRFGEWRTRPRVLVVRAGRTRTGVDLGSLHHD